METTRPESISEMPKVKVLTGFLRKKTERAPIRGMSPSSGSITTLITPWSWTEKKKHHKWVFCFLACDDPQVQVKSMSPKTWFCWSDVTFSVGQTFHLWSKWLAFCLRSQTSLPKLLLLVIHSLQDHLILNSIFFLPLNYLLSLRIQVRGNKSKTGDCFVSSLSLIASP